MKLGASVLILGAVWLVVMMWDAGSFSWVSHTVLYFIDIPQFLYVALPALAVTAIVHSWGGMVSGIAMGLGLMANAEKEDVVKGGRALKFLGQVACWGGVVVTLIEVVVSAHNSASLAGFLPALGVAMLGLFYGLLIWVACGLGVQIIKVRLGPFVYYSE